MFFWRLLERIHPRIGWRQLALALSAALCPAIAATDSKLTLPGWLFFWAGLFGLLLGLRIGRMRTSGTTRTSGRLVVALLGAVGWLALVLGLGALVVVAAGQTLPPFGLIAQDLIAFFGWANAALHRRAGLGDLPAGRTWEFLAATLPRFWQNILNSPNDGARGAQLLVAAGGSSLSWMGAVALGWALAQRRSTFAWSLPLLTAIALTAILSGGSGAALPIGLALLLLLAGVAGFGKREQDWDRRGADYSEELGNDLLAWGGLLAALVLMLALVLPTSLDNPLADLLWHDVQLPSGIAELEKNIPRAQPPPAAPVGLSHLPALELGQSLEVPPAEQIVLRIHLSTPLKPSAWPQYWRARVFNIYNGKLWTTNALVGTFDASAPPDTLPPGAVLQDIEDLRSNHSILVALPDVQSVSVPVQAERLPDGALVALTEVGEAGRYRVLSWPQELAAQPRLDGPPPDMSGYLQLPQGYPPRVSDLARVIAAGANTSYDQALALEAYLRGLPYSYQVQPLPGQGDAVEQFLFDMRQGYCTYYASAMAVMARSLGIPARVAVGYATGSYDAASGAYWVREADAHAWPELYINGRWMPFEPTPIRALPARTSAEDTPAPVTAATPDEQTESSRGPLIWVAVLAIVALLTGAGLWWRRPRRPQELATQVQRRLERSGAQAGVAWPPGATLHEYGALLEPRSSDQPALREVLDLVGRARYGGRPLHSDEEGQLRAAAERLWARR